MKRLCLTALTALALLALGGVGSAAGDAICKANEAPCTAGNAYAVGTTFKTQIKTGTKVVFAGSPEFVCTASTWEGPLSLNPHPGNNNPATVDQKSETFTGCSSPTFGTCSVSKATNLWLGDGKWYAYSASPGDGFTAGTTTAARLIEFVCGGIPCNWSISEEVSHDYDGGNPAVESWKTRYVRAEGSSVFCGKEVVGTGERVFSAPTGSIFWTYG